MKKNSAKTNKTKLPRFLEPLFWDYEFNLLSWQSDDNLTILLVLASGDWRAVNWLRRSLGDQQLRRWLLARGGRGLDPKRLRFWELVLDLPHRTANDWLTPEIIADPMKLARDLQQEGVRLGIGQIDRGTLHGVISGVLVSFLEYRYPLLEPPVIWSPYRCLGASLDDLACMKEACYVIPCRDRQHGRH